MQQISLIGSDLSGAFLDSLVTWLVHKFTLLTVTMWAIQFVSTIPERILLLILCSLLMAAILAFARWVRPPRLQPFILIVGALLLFRGFYLIFPTDSSGDIALFLVVLVTIIHFWGSLSSTTPQPNVPRFGIVRLVLSVILVPALAVLFVNGWSLQGLAQTLHRDKSVQKLDGIQLNSLALDTQNSLLYASGHGTEYLLAYDVHDPTHVPRRSKVRTDYTQSFSYNPGDQELYVYNDHNHTLLYLTAGTLEQKKSIPDIHMTEGDSRIAYDKQTSSLIIASEGEYWGAPSDENGYGLVVVDRESGTLRYTVKDCDGFCTPALIEVHPTKPLLYLGFAKKVQLYNMALRKAVATAPAKEQWVDGMVVTPDEKELLIGVPLSSAVLRLDAESLQLKGAINTVFGVRTLAVDPERQLLLTASLATNMLDVIDLKTSKRLANYYVAPWLRSICLDTKAGVAYVSSTEGLFKVDYTAYLK